MSKKTNILSSATEEELEGVEAIQYFHNLSGHKEPRWVSLRNWRCFTEIEKTYTLDVYRSMTKEKDGKRKEENIQASETPDSSGDDSRGSGGDGPLELGDS